MLRTHTRDFIPIKMKRLSGGRVIVAKVTSPEGGDQITYIGMVTGMHGKKLQLVAELEKQNAWTIFLEPFNDIPKLHYVLCELIKLWHAEEGETRATIRLSRGGYQDGVVLGDEVAYFQDVPGFSHMSTRRDKSQLFTINAPVFIKDCNSAKKVAFLRRRELLEKAKSLSVTGRHAMSKNELAAAVTRTDRR